MEFHPNFCQNQIFFPYYIKKHKSCLNLGSSGLCLQMLHRTMCLHVGLLPSRVPPQPLATLDPKTAIWGGLSQGPSISCQLCYLSSQSSMEWHCAWGNHHYKPGSGDLKSGSYGRTKLPENRELLNQAAERSTLVAAQQEKCLLSPKLFFLVFWTKSSFAIKFASHVTLKMAVILDCSTDIKIIYYRSSFH